MKVVAFERAKQGTGASRRLRNAGRTPGIIAYSLAMMAGNIIKPTDMSVPST